jgi:hypothetical protein
MGEPTMFADWFEHERRKAKAQLAFFTPVGTGRIRNGPTAAEDATSEVVARLEAWLVELDELQVKFGSAPERHV